MRGIWIVALLALASAAAAEKPQPVYALEVAGEIEIATDGTVRDYRLDSELTPEVTGLIDRNLRGWQFEPILIDGRPVIAATRLRMALNAEPVDGGYRLRVENVWFGEPASNSRMKPPRYPKQALLAGLGARVVLVLKLDEGGNVLDIHPEQTSLSASGGSTVEERWRRVFEKASVAAAWKWSFDVSEKLDGRPVASEIRIPVAFRIQPKGDRSIDGHWSRFVPGPVRPIPWVSEDSLADAVDLQSLREGEARPLNSHFRLRDEIVGTVL